MLAAFYWALAYALIATLRSRAEAVFVTSANQGVAG
jgi:hypothetical protein